MTRRELREHCFKMLFSVDFYTTGEEAKAQMQQYFQSPEEDDTAEDGSLQVVHKVAAGEKDREYLSTRTADVVDKIEEIDAKIDEVAAEGHLHLRFLSCGHTRPLLLCILVRCDCFP